jgi:hypothetical protein
MLAYARLTHVMIGCIPPLLNEDDPELIDQQKKKRTWSWKILMAP